MFNFPGTRFYSELLLFHHNICIVTSSQDKHRHSISCLEELPSYLRNDRLRQTVTYILDMAGMGISHDRS